MKPTEEEMNEFIGLLETHGHTYVNNIRRNEDARVVADRLLQRFLKSTDEKKRMKCAEGIRTLYVIFGDTAVVE
tara:strand:+ start:313 stop:534 length:222 start_codon:yes stop_codon:yes gene_type:complete